MKVEKYRNGVLSVYFIFVIVCCVLLCEGMNFLIPEGYVPFTSQDLGFISTLALLSLIVFIVLDLKKNRTHINWGLFIFFTLMTALGLIGLLNPYLEYFIKGYFPTEFYEYDLTKFCYSIISLIIGNITMYIMVAVLPKRIVRIKSLTIVYWLAIIFGLVAFGYSLATEGYAYSQIFTTDSENYISINSFFDNENSYGQLLMLAIFSILVIDSIRSHWFYIILEMFFLVGIIFSTSVTAFGMSIVAMFAYYLYKFFASIKLHPVKNCFIFALAFFAISGLGLLYLYLVKNELYGFNYLQDFIASTMLNKNLATATGRTENWSMAISALYGVPQMMFGLGYGVSNDYIANYTLNVYGETIRNLDSTYVQLVCTYGFVGLSVYLIMLIGLVVALIILIFKKRSNVGFPFLILLLCFMVYGVFETSLLFSSGTVGFYSTFLLILPVLVEYEKVKSNPVIQNNLMRNDISAQKLNAEEIMTIYSLPFFVIGMVSLLLLFVSHSIDRRLPIGMCLASFAIYFTFPFFMAMMRRRYVGKWFALKASISLILIIASPIITFITLQSLNHNTLNNSLISGGVYLGLIILFNLYFILNRTSTLKESFILLVKVLIFNNLFPLLIFGVFIVPITLLVTSLQIDFYCKIIYLIGATLVFGLLMFYMPSPNKSNQKYRGVIDKLNDRLLVKQKMYFVVGDRRLPDGEIILPTKNS